MDGGEMAVLIFDQQQPKKEVLAMKSSLAQNMGTLDRILRMGLGITLVVFGILVVQGTMGIILVILSIPLLLSATIGFCPGYVPFGICTKKQKAC